MLSMIQQLTAIGNDNLDAALKFASDTARMTERVVKSQVDATNELLDSSNEQLQILGSKPGSAASFASWQSAYQANSERVLQIIHRYFADVSKIQAEMARLTMEQVAAAHENTIKNFGGFATAAAEEAGTVTKTTSSRVRKKHVV